MELKCNIYQITHKILSDLLPIRFIITHLFLHIIITHLLLNIYYYTTDLFLDIYYYPSDSLLHIIAHSLLHICYYTFIITQQIHCTHKILSDYSDDSFV